MKIQKFVDESTTESYKFLVYCEHCGKLVTAYSSTPDSCYKPKLFMNSAKRRAKELLWISGHEKAFEAASSDALSKLNRCEICGKLVCDDCYVISEKLDGGVCCKACSEL